MQDDAIACEQTDFHQVDRVPEDYLKRVLRRAMRGPREPYPSRAVTLVNDEDDDDGDETVE
jgi:hypothetical protein